MNELETLRGAHVLALGDVMLDEYVWGEVERISPEAPVPVVQVQRRTYGPGGAANAAVGIAAFGSRAVLGGVVGADAAADQLRQVLERAGVEVEGLVEDATRATTTKTRVVAHSQQMVRMDSEDSRPLDANFERQLIDWVSAQVPEVDAILLSDYSKGVLSVTVVRAVIEVASRHGKPVVVDPKGRDYARYRGATVITPNLAEVGRAANLDVHRSDDLREAARRVSVSCGGAALLVTRGAAGMTLFHEGGPVDIAADAQDVYDVTGAGDTVAAVIAVALARSWPLLDAVRLANTAAGVVVAKIGAAAATLEEVQRILRARSL